MKQTVAEIQARQIKFRPSFGMMMEEILRERGDVVLLVADSARACRLEICADIAPRVVECGIAEQNMIGVAAGMARSGTKPIAFAFSPFASERCFEQIRLDVAYSNLSVVVVGGEAGVGMGTQGVTHYGWEDMAVMCSVPNMTVLCPADHLEMYKCVQHALTQTGPVYIRLTGGVPKRVYDTDYEYEIGRAVRLREGGDACIIATGTMVSVALDAAARLEAEGKHVGVINMHTIKPLDEEAVLATAANVPVLVTLEEHSVINGMGSAVANALAQAGRGVKFRKIGLPDCYPQVVSPYSVMLEDYGLTPEQVADSIRELL